MLRFEDFHLLRAELELGLQFRHPGSAFLSFLVQAHQLCLQFRQATERFLAGRNLRVLRLDVAFYRGESVLRPLEGPFKDFQPEELLEHRETLRAARGPELLHLLLSDEGRVPKADVVEPDHIPDRALLVRDCPLNCFPVSADLQVGLLLRREAACDLPPFVAWWNATRTYPFGRQMSASFTLWMSVRVVLPYRAKVIASRIDDLPAPVRPVITVYFSGNRSGGTVFSRYRMKPRISISSRMKPSGP